MPTTPTSDLRPSDFDPGTWKDARWSRWSFRNTAAFLPTTPIAPSSEPRALSRGLVEEPDGWEAFLSETHATSALILRGGRVVTEWPRGAADDPRPHMLFSITKSVVGLIALILIARGEVDPDRPAAAYLPDLTGTAFANATLAHLLTMSDRVAFDETYADHGAEIHRYSKGYWGEAVGGVVAALRALPVREPGPAFAYRTPVADVVGLILSAATGMRLAELVGNLLWRPMGAAYPAHFILDTAGIEIAGAGLNASTGDLARLALLLLDGGSWNDRTIVPRRAIGAMAIGGDRSAFSDAYSDRKGWSYRDLWWHCGGHSLAALGVHGQRIMLDFDRGAALIRTGAAPLPDNRPFDDAHAKMFSGISAR